MRTITRTAVRCAVGVWALAAGLAGARPLIAYEAFDYNPSPFPLPGCNGLFGWAGPWTAGPFESVGGSLTHSFALPSTGRRCRGTGPMEAFRPLAASLAPTATADVWVSVLMRSPAGGTTTEFVLQDFATSSTVVVRRVPLAPFFLQANAASLTGGAASGINETDLLVVRLRLMGAGTEVSLYHNPPNETAVPAVTLPLVPGVLTIAQVYMLVDSVQEIDEIRIGDQFGVVAGVQGCYPDCNQDGALTVADFGCFQGKYVLGDPYADCTAEGSLTVADFGCFQGKYVLGCP